MIGYRTLPYSPAIPPLFAGHSLNTDNSVTGGLLGAATLLVLNYCVVRFLYGHEQLERLVEGEADVLIENGVIQHDRLRRELITVPELEMAAHKQGITTLAEVDRAVLEPGGTLSFFAKKPTIETTRHQELVGKLAEIARELETLKTAVERPA